MLNSNVAPVGRLAVLEVSDEAGGVDFCLLVAFGEAFVKGVHLSA